MFMVTPAHIKKIRESLGLNPTELAARLGVCENSVRRWEIGLNRPRGSSLKLLQQLAHEAKVTA